MKKSGVFAISLLLTCTSASFAADLPVKHAVKPMPVAAMRTSGPDVATRIWEGCYIGGNGGAAAVNADVTDKTSSTNIADLESAAMAGGAQIGCDYQYPGNSSWLFGLQGMFDATMLSSSTKAVLLNGSEVGVKTPWLATATARAGYLVTPDVLAYGKAGAAWAHSTSTVSTNGVTDDSVAFNQLGWTIGAGAEWKATDYFSVFAEYSYVGLADHNVTYTNTKSDNTVNQDLQLMLVGVNFRVIAL